MFSIGTVCAVAFAIEYEVSQISQRSRRLLNKIRARMSAARREREFLTLQVIVLRRHKQER